MKTWLRAMGGQAPKFIVTDVDKTLKAAIEEVFPNTHHCFSLWHILERQLNSIAHSHDGFFGTQQSVHGLVYSIL